MAEPCKEAVEAAERLVVHDGIPELKAIQEKAAVIIQAAMEARDERVHQQFSSIKEPDAAGPPMPPNDTPSKYAMEAGRNLWTAGLGRGGKTLGTHSPPIIDAAYAPLREACKEMVDAWSTMSNGLGLDISKSRMIMDAKSALADATPGEVSDANT